MSKAIITGINGQTGSYLAEHLLSLGYEVIGMVRRASTNNLERLAAVLAHSNLKLEMGDLTDFSSVLSLVEKYKPDEFYNLAAQSFVGTSFEQPTFTFNVNTLGVVNVLEAIRMVSPTTRLLHTSTSEMFGSNYNKYTLCQDEDTPFMTNSPYAASKIAAHQMCQLYRKSYGLNITCSIAFNNESPRRGLEFVTRKITRYLGRLYRGKTKDKLKLGNIHASRDWGYAAEYAQVYHMLLQEDVGDDYVIATGETHTVEEFLKLSFSLVGLDWKDYVEIDQSCMRPSEVPYLRGDSSKLRNKFSWRPKTTFKELVEFMVNHDIQNV